MGPRCRVFRESRRGNAATEFAFILPIMLLFIGGVVEFGRIYQTYNAVNRLATRYAVTYADCFDTPAGACDNNTGHELAIFSSTTAIKNIVPQLTNTGSMTVLMYDLTMSSATPPAATVKYSNTAVPLTSAQLSTAQTAIGPSQEGVLVTVSYTHQLLFFSQLIAPFIPASKLAVSYTVAQRKT